MGHYIRDTHVVTHKTTFVIDNTKAMPCISLGLGEADLSLTSSVAFIITHLLILYKLSTLSVHLSFTLRNSKKILLSLYLHNCPTCTFRT